MAKNKKIENMTAQMFIIEKAKEFIFEQKHEDWVSAASKLNEEELNESVKIMEMLDCGISSKKASKVVDKISNKDTRARVIKVVTEFSKQGPEFAFDRLTEKQGTVNRSNEYVQGLFHKMDENCNFRHEESKKEQRVDDEKKQKEQENTEELDEQMALGKGD